MELIRRAMGWRRPEPVPSNSCFAIYPYKERGIWVFDQPDLGLFKEAFVMGMPQIIEEMTGHDPAAEQGFGAIFSRDNFPGAKWVLQLVREELGGNWYKLGGTDLEGWLCPALFKFFPSAPDNIWVQTI